MSKVGRIGGGLAIVIACVAAAGVQAEPPKPAAEPTQQRMRMHHGGGSPLHGEMREKMRAHDARLDELVAAMNAAQGDAKIDAIAAVVNELVAQRRTRRDHMETRWQRQQGRHDGHPPRGDAP